MMKEVYIFVCIVGVISKPVDDPIRIDLPVYDQPRSASEVTLAEPLEPENHPGSSLENDKSPESNLVTSKEHIFNKNTQEYPPVGSVNHVRLFTPRVTKLEGALLETEDLGSKTLSIKENAESFVAGIFQPQPIVDTIKEEDKYGNDGGKFRDASRAIVGGAEGISNFFNTIFEVPGKIIKKITRAATEKLNDLGGKLIGL